MPKVVTANELATGVVVFLADRGGWTREIADARSFPDAESAEEGLAAAKADEAKAIIVEPFVADMGEAVDGRPKMTLRDTIRAFGPTIAFLPADQGPGRDAAQG